jgi:hypothetical protein
VRDAQLLACRGIDVLLHVAIRIDDDGFAGLLTTDHVAGLGETAIEKTLEEHWLPSVRIPDVSREAAGFEANHAALAPS